MTPDERAQLLDDLVARLEGRASVDGGRLLDLMRAEQNLQDALGAIRKEIALILRLSG